MKSKIDMKTLKSQFDKVLLKHEKGENNMGGRTTVALVKGDDVFGGVAMCFETDQFDRAKGRQIAIGRALHAYHVFTNVKLSRVRKHSNSYYGRLVYSDNQTKPNILIEKVV